MAFYKPQTLMQVFALTFLLFINGFSAKTCNFDVKLKQALLNEGFHRNVTYGIVFDSDGEGSWMYQDCILGVDQNLPPGVYANPDELGHLRRTHKLNAIPKNRVNVESTAEQSSPSNVYIIGKVIESKVYLWLPVHARYHQAEPGGGMARNIIDPPRLYLHCPDHRLDVCGESVTAASFLCNGSSREKCKWTEISYTLLTGAVQWEVPVGNTAHLPLVLIGTSLLVFIGSLYLLKAVHEYQVRVRKKNQ